MWLIMVFPILFTVGMCLIDTIDGALMSSLYLAPMAAADVKDVNEDPGTMLAEIEVEDEENRRQNGSAVMSPRVRSPLTFLYYSTVLTALTVVVALVIGVIQLLSLILNVGVSQETAENSKFWQGVELAGEYYDVIGGIICGSFVIVGIASVFCYRPWRRWVDRERARLRVVDDEPDRGTVELLDDNVEGLQAGQRNLGVQPTGDVRSSEPTGPAGIDSILPVLNQGKSKSQTQVKVINRGESSK